jgi:hypothetical protein
MDNAFSYFEDTAPMSETDYPYVRSKESTCRAVTSKETAAAKVTGFFDVPSNNVNAMM